MLTPPNRALGVEDCYGLAWFAKPYGLTSVPSETGRQAVSNPRMHRWWKNGVLERVFEHL